MYLGGVHGDERHAHPAVFDAGYCFDSRKFDLEVSSHDKVASPEVPIPEWYLTHALGSEDIIMDTCDMYQGKKNQMKQDIRNFQENLRRNQDRIMESIFQTCEQYVRIPREKESRERNIEGIMNTLEGRIDYILSLTPLEIANQLQQVNKLRR